MVIIAFLVYLWRRDEASLPSFTSKSTLRAPKPLKQKAVSKRKDKILPPKDVQKASNGAPLKPVASASDDVVPFDDASGVGPPAFEDNIGMKAVAPMEEMQVIDFDAPSSNVSLLNQIVDEDPIDLMYRAVVVQKMLRAHKTRKELQRRMADAKAEKELAEASSFIQARFRGRHAMKQMAISRAAIKIQRGLIRVNAQKEARATLEAVRAEATVSKASSSIQARFRGRRIWRQQRAAKAATMIQRAVRRKKAQRQARLELGLPTGVNLAVQEF